MNKFGQVKCCYSVWGNDKRGGGSTEMIPWPSGNPDKAMGKGITNGKGGDLSQMSNGQNITEMSWANLGEKATEPWLRTATFFLSSWVTVASQPGGGVVMAFKASFSTHLAVFGARQCLPILKVMRITEFFPRLPNLEIPEGEAARTVQSGTAVPLPPHYLRLSPPHQWAITRLVLISRSVCSACGSSNGIDTADKRLSFSNLGQCILAHASTTSFH
ncbi:hypothetical protein B0H16DRAFT_1460143 [Mycena metata]|uniref:Uncharacterized protein n=1 Tax=Mycena metata TaxID=1033252 RepID=A0AAD7NAI3_9AGAR|nr:hypothetical protein B0H16DRAFT_1460143 [Mycena metata]